MKNFVVCILLAFAFGTTSFSQTLNTGETFEEKNGGGTCSCTGLLCSASKKCPKTGQSCTCTCTLSVCTCSGCGLEAKPTVSDQQVQNRRELISILRSSRDAKALQAADLIEGAFRSLEADNLTGYIEQGKRAEETLQFLSVTDKSTLNAWLTQKDSSIRF